MAVHFSPVFKLRLKCRDRTRRVTLILPRGKLEFAPDEVFDALIACQTQTDERTLALQVDVKIKKGAALAFSNDPIGQLGNGYSCRAELKFIALFRLHNFCATAD